MSLLYDLERASPERREVIQQAIDYLTHGVAGPELAGYATPWVGAMIIGGRSPSELAPQLSSAEAHEWAHQTVHAEPHTWLWDQIVSSRPELVGAHTDIVEVMRWAADAMDDPRRRSAMLAHRTAIFGGGAIEGSAVSRLDELRPCDLRRSISDTLEAAVERHARDEWEGPEELRAADPWHDRLPAECRVLRTWTDLRREGAQMRHCVAQYAEQIAAGQCLMLAIDADDGSRSTAQIERGSVVQHHGPRNTTPSDACKRVVESAAQVIRKFLARRGP